MRRGTLGGPPTGVTAAGGAERALGDRQTWHHIAANSRSPLAILHGAEETLHGMAPASANLCPAENGSQAPAADPHGLVTLLERLEEELARREGDALEVEAERFPGQDPHSEGVREGLARAALCLRRARRAALAQVPGWVGQDEHPAREAASAQAERNARLRGLLGQRSTPAGERLFWVLLRRAEELAAVRVECRREGAQYVRLVGVDRSRAAAYLYPRGEAWRCEVWTPVAEARERGEKVVRTRESAEFGYAVLRFAEAGQVEALAGRIAGAVRQTLPREQAQGRRRH